MKRAYRTRPRRERYLIVCEGIETEPNYFNALKDCLPPNLVDIDIVGAGANTFSVVARATELRDIEASTDRPYDHVWVIFDRDSFPPDHFDNAINSATANRMNVGWSNEAFEIWYVLHFVERITAMSRTAFQNELSHHLGITYRKNSREMYALLQERGVEEDAHRRAVRLQKEHTATPPSRSNPCTYVNGIVACLNAYKVNDC